MGLNKRDDSGKVFANVLSDGSIRVEVKEETPGAVKREYKTSDGKEGSKWEMVYDSLDGIITDVRFKETDFGTFINADIQDDGSITCLGFNVENSFGQDFMKKLPNVDLTRIIRVVPYSLDTKEGKNLKGVTIYQGGNKLKNYFFDDIAKKSLYGFPPAEYAKKFATDSERKDYWKIHFMGVKHFFMKFITENVVTKFEHDASNGQEDGINIEEVAKALEPQEVPASAQPTLPTTLSAPSAPPAPEKPSMTEADYVRDITIEATRLYGVLPPEDLRNRVMAETGIAFAPPFFPKLLEELKKL